MFWLDSRISFACVIHTLGETNLICCSTGPTDPVFAKNEKIIISIFPLYVYLISSLCCKGLPFSKPFIIKNDASSGKAIIFGRQPKMSG